MQELYNNGARNAALKAGRSMQISPSRHHPDGGYQLMTPHGFGRWKQERTIAAMLRLGHGALWELISV
jgi:hypothetical protein